MHEEQRVQAHDRWNNWLTANGGDLPGAVKLYGSYKAARLAYLNSGTYQPDDETGLAGHPDGNDERW
jgi:hypothetical protein